MGNAIRKCPRGLSEQERQGQLGTVPSWSTKPDHSETLLPPCNCRWCVFSRDSTSDACTRTQRGWWRIIKYILDRATRPLALYCIATNTPIRRSVPATSGAPTAPADLRPPVPSLVASSSSAGSLFARAPSLSLNARRVPAAGLGKTTAGATTGKSGRAHARRRQDRSETVRLQRGIELLAGSAVSNQIPCLRVHVLLWLADQPPAVVLHGCAHTVQVMKYRAGLVEHLAERVLSRCFFLNSTQTTRVDALNWFSQPGGSSGEQVRGFDPADG